MYNTYKKILVITLLVVTVFTSSTCLAAGIFDPEAKKDFTAVGMEPFWSLHIFTDDTIVFSTPEGSIGFVYIAPIVNEKEYCYNLKNNILLGTEISMQVVVREESAMDPMAGRTYPYIVKIRLNGRTYEGFGYIDKKTVQGEIL